MARKTKITGIYKITHLSSGRVYIGSAKDIKSRWDAHRSSFPIKGRGNPYLSNAWVKYGENDFEFEVIETVSNKGDLLEREQYWIDKYNAANREFGFNIAPKAGSNLGVKMPTDTVEKLAKINKGKKRTEETRRKMSDAAIGNKNGLGSHWHGDLTENDVRCIFVATAGGEHTKHIAARYGVSVATVGRIITRNTWWSVEIPKDILESAQKMYKNQRTQSLRATRSVTKLLPYQVSVIKRRLINNEVGSSIALEFGVKPETVYAIKAGRIWADVEPL
jgi:group I intron endonuclease